MADPVAAVSALCDRVPDPVRWLGLGPMSNLAAVLAARLELAPRLHVTQMGGALAYRDPTVAQYNFRLDPAAVRSVLAAAGQLRLITYDVTFAPDIAISAESPIYRRLGQASQRWATVLAAQCDRYCAGYYPSTIPHTPLTLSVALDEPFVELARRRIRVDEAGRMRLANDGVLTTLSVGADHRAFANWLNDQLDPDNSPLPMRPC